MKNHDLMIFDIYEFRHDIEFVFPKNGPNTNDDFFSLNGGKTWYWEHCIWSFVTEEMNYSFYLLVGTFKCKDLVFF
jgi:hypothetical protein